MGNLNMLKERTPLACLILGVTLGGVVWNLIYSPRVLSAVSPLSEAYNQEVEVSLS